MPVKKKSTSTGIEVLGIHYWMWEFREKTENPSYLQDKMRKTRKYNDN